MRLKVLGQIGLLIATITLAGCSKQEPPTEQAAAANQQTSTNTQEPAPADQQTPPSQQEAAPSQQTSASSDADTAANQSAPLTLLNVYFLGNKISTTDWYRITELENTGNAGIKAFEGTWIITDDLGATVSQQDVRYTSDTSFYTPNGDQSPHVIAPGEKFVIINKDDSDVTSDIASTKDDLTNCIYGYADFMKLASELSTNGGLESYRSTQKTTFQVDKCVTQ